MKSKTGEQNKGNRALHFKVQKFRTVESNMRKCIPRCEIPKAKFCTPQSKVRKFRTMRNTLLAHEWHFAQPKPIFAQCESRCENFAHQNPRCEIHFKVRKSQSNVRILYTSVSHTTIQGAKIFAPCEAPLWHTSAITLGIEMVSHNAKQGAKFSHSAKLSAKLDSRCKILNLRCENFAR